MFVRYDSGPDVRANAFLVRGKSKMTRNNNARNKMKNCGQSRYG